MTDLPDGIYFNLSFDDYLAQPRISSSSITGLMEGPSSFWAASWMNPNQPEDEETKAMIHGAAYHCARLEPDEFPKRYTRQLVQSDFGPDLLTNATQVGNALAALGEPKTSVNDGGAMGQAQRLRDMASHDTPPIWCLELAAWEAEIGDKTPIDPKTWEEILRDQQTLHTNPVIKEKISGGAAEVSILWTDPETGIRCKIRPDYLGKDWVTHVKTWDNRTPGRPGNQSVAALFQHSGYYRTGWFYEMGLANLAGLPAYGSVTKDHARLYDDWQKSRFETWFLFIRRSGIPDVRARRVKYHDLPPGVEEQGINASRDDFRRSLRAIGMKADIEIRSCLKLYKDCLSIYGADGDPWLPLDMIGDFEDADFSSFWLDSLSNPS